MAHLLISKDLQFPNQNSGELIKKTKEKNCNICEISQISWNIKIWLESEKGLR